MRMKTLGIAVVLGTPLIFSACQKAKQKSAQAPAPIVSSVGSISPKYKNMYGKPIVKDFVRGGDLVSARMAGGKNAIGIFNKLQLFTDGGPGRKRADTIEMPGVGGDLKVPVKGIVKLEHATKGDMVAIKVGVCTIIGLYDGFAGGIAAQDEWKRNPDGVWAVAGANGPVYVRKEIRLKNVRIPVGGGKYFRTNLLVLPISEITGVDIYKLVHDKPAKHS